MRLHRLVVATLFTAMLAATAIAQAAEPAKVSFIADPDGYTLEIF